MCRNYEEEFEYVWERLCMYDTCQRYHLFSTAMERAGAEGNEGERRLYEERAQESAQKLKELCKTPAYEQNRPYAELYWEEAMDGTE